VRLVGPLVLDVVVVIIFCGIGRSSHDEAIAAGLFRTAWPFTTGLLLGWLALFAATRGRAEPLALWPSGVAAWLGALVGGMALRVLAGQGTAVSFIIVAAIFLALFLLGWRAVAWLSRRRARRAPGDDHAASVVH
jgi:hypothetical protein